jgi:hypothetical protein
VQALELGKVKVVVKSIGNACQPFSPLAQISSSNSRCNSENKVARVYSQDTLIVNVLELHSINIHTPIKSLKKGNEMPVYLMGNEKSLSALNFGSCPHLKYQWKLNDQQIGSLHHVLLESNINEAAIDQQGGDDGALLEKAFSLRLLARQPGTVKISVRVEYKNAKDQIIRYFIFKN